MPSPLGHALAGLTAGWLVASPAPGDSRRHVAGRAGLYSAAGMLPDIDLLFGSHSGPTHGLGSAVIAGALTMLIARRARRPTSLAWLTVGLGVACAYGSHTLLDWLGTDTSPPIGIMALWPFSREYYESPQHLFMAISRRYWLPEFWTYNLGAIGRELAILIPAAALVLLRKSRTIVKARSSRTA